MKGDFALTGASTSGCWLLETCGLEFSLYSAGKLCFRRARCCSHRDHTIGSLMVATIARLKAAKSLVSPYARPQITASATGAGSTCCMLAFG